MKDYVENIFDLANKYPFDRVESNIITDKSRKFTFRRDNRNNILLDVLSVGNDTRDRSGKKYRKGEFIKSEDTITLEIKDFVRVSADHLIFTSSKEKLSDNHEFVRTDTYSVNSLSIDFLGRDEVSYVIDYVENIPSYYFPNDNMSHESNTISKVVLGKGERKVEIPDYSSDEGSTRIFYVNISGIDVYVLQNREIPEKKYRTGAIVYRGNVSESERRAIRECISFVLGRPIVYLGYCQYDEKFDAVSIYAGNASTFDGNAYEVNHMPPYPLGENGYDNLLDNEKFYRSVNALYQSYSRLKLEEAYWMYWHAVLAPVHNAAISFGGLLEHIHRNISADLPKLNTKLIDDDNWKIARKSVIELIESLGIADNEKKILINKISNLNQVPANLLFKRMLEHLKLEFSDIEAEAWKHRNIAAHGGISDKHINTILGARLLRILFHRILARASGCSDEYVDYYSVGFPIRGIAQSITERR